jgi:hypothetical protein
MRRFVLVAFCSIISALYAHVVTATSSYATIVLCSLRNALRKRGARASDNELSEM